MVSLATAQCLRYSVRHHTRVARNVALTPLVKRTKKGGNERAILSSTTGRGNAGRSGSSNVSYELAEMYQKRITLLLIILFVALLGT